MSIFSKMCERYKLKLDIDIAEKENKLMKTTAQKEMLNANLSMMERVTNSGYSHGGASTDATWAKQYRSESLSARSDIEENRKTLRERTRDLAMNAPIATAAVNATRTNVVGPGLSPKPKIDYDFLGITKEEAEELQKQIKKEFNLWAESTLCDNNDQNNFYELQQIIFNDWLRNGEGFCLIKQGKELPYMPYQLRLKLIEADRVSSPNSFDADYMGYDSVLKNGNRIMNGVEIDSEGKVVAYHISSNHPGEHNEKITEWARVEKRGKLTGNPNILHVFNAERSEQYRGVPFLAPVIHSIKQVTRYTEAEIMAAVINSMLAIFIQTETGEEVDFGFSGVGDEEWNTPIGEKKEESDEIKMGYGNVNFLKTGEKVVPVESTHPSGNFDSFLRAMVLQVGAALEIAPEVLLKQFSNSFSASKGAINETWKAFMMRRKWFVDDFCQEIYNLWFAEAVAKGRIKAPGFFMDPLIRKAYINCTWTGPAQGCLDPGKEANAAIMRISNGLSTHEDECAAINGSDFDDNIRTLKGENEKLSETNKCMQTAVVSNDEEQDKEEENQDEEDEDAEKD